MPSANLGLYPAACKLVLIIHPGDSNRNVKLPIRTFVN